MPRTKKPVRNQEKITEDDDALKKLNKHVLELKNKIDSHARLELGNVELAFKILLGSFNTSYLQKTVGQLKTELNLKEQPIRQTDSQNTRRSASHDDGYLTENSSQGSGERHLKKTFLAPPPSARARRSRSANASSRSVDASSRSAAAGARSQRRHSRSAQRTPAAYRTPAYNKHAATYYPAITPKVNPQTPLTVIRQPRQGEMVLSMSGSPVMVPACYSMKPEEKANCNILLQDGTTLSLQPKQLRRSQAYIPFSLMDSKVLHQLKTLKDNLGTIVELGEKAMVK